jgi:dTDP-glucose 4,6-dehydratase
VGASHELRNIDVIKKILSLTGATMDSVRPVADRPGHDFRYAVNTTKIRTLGWKPRVTFDEGLARTVDWYAANKH